MKPSYNRKFVDDGFFTNIEFDMSIGLRLCDQNGDIISRLTFKKSKVFDQVQIRPFSGELIVADDGKIYKVMNVVWGEQRDEKEREYPICTYYLKLIEDEHVC